MTRARKPRALVFDLDGTLLDSLPLVLNAIAHALEPFGPRPKMEIFAKLGGPPERFLQTLLEDVRHVPEAMARMDAFHRGNSHLIQPFLGVPQFLARLAAERVPLGIWTGRDRDSARWLLDSLKLSGFFAAMVCGDDLPTHKPDPEGLREIVRRLGVEPADTLFVGDADVDVLGGAACGVDTLLIQHGREVAESVLAKSWRTAGSPGEAFEIVLGCLDLTDQPAPR